MWRQGWRGIWRGVLGRRRFLISWPFWWVLRGWQRIRSIKEKARKSELDKKNNENKYGRPTSLTAEALAFLAGFSTSSASSAALFFPAFFGGTLTSASSSLSLPSSSELDIGSGIPTHRPPSSRLQLQTGKAILLLVFTLRLWMLSHGSIGASSPSSSSLPF